MLAYTDRKPLHKVSGPLAIGRPRKVMRRGCPPVQWAVVFLPQKANPGGMTEGTERTEETEKISPSRSAPGRDLRTSVEVYSWRRDPKVASDQRGHGIGVSLEVYTSSDHSQKRDALKKLEAAVIQKAATEAIGASLVRSME